MKPDRTAPGVRVGRKDLRGAQNVLLLNTGLVTEGVAAAVIGYGQQDILSKEVEGADEAVFGAGHPGAGNARGPSDAHARRPCAGRSTRSGYRADTEYGPGGRQRLRHCHWLELRRERDGNDLLHRELDERQYRRGISHRHHRRRRHLYDRRFAGAFQRSAWPVSG